MVHPRAQSDRQGGGCGQGGHDNAGWCNRHIGCWRGQTLVLAGKDTCCQPLMRVFLGNEQGSSCKLNGTKAVP